MSSLGAVVLGESPSVAHRSLACRRLAATLVVAAMTSLAACGDDGGDDSKRQRPAATADTFIGTVSGTRAYIALVVQGERFAGYACDGRETSIWLDRVKVAGGRAELRTRDGKRLGEGTVTRRTVSGRITLAGAPHAFTATRATGRAGLYRRVSGTRGRPGYRESGWIVLSDGSVRGATNFADGSVRATSAKPSGKVSMQDF